MKMTIRPGQGFRNITLTVAYLTISEAVGTALPMVK
jgi:hypothetical protein